MFAEYGVLHADLELLGRARALVAEVVKQADATITGHFETYKALPQNPYTEHAMFDGRELRHATVVPLQRPYDLHGLAQATLGERAGSVDLARITEKAVGELAEHLKAHGYELAAVQRHAMGKGIAAIAVRDPVYVKQAEDKEVDAAGEAAVKLRGDIGFRSTCSTTELKAARAVVDELCNDALAKVAMYLRTTCAAGGSPFADDSPAFESRLSVIVDKRRVSGERYNRVEHGVAIAVGLGSDLTKRLTERVGTRAKIDSDTFFAFVRLNLADRLRERPELMAALVGCSTHRDASYVEDHHFSVVCSPEPPAPPPPPPTLLQRLVGYLAAPIVALRESVRAALPAPTPPPKALPPPAPEAIPPVTLPVASRK